jgi:hypothetical protein
MVMTADCGSHFEYGKIGSLAVLTASVSYHYFVAHGLTSGIP